ncbi:MAG: helicase-related protein [Pirellulaceae bacterium]
MRISLGQLIGYQVRFDSRVSPASRLIAMTPGILRHLQSDGVLTDVAAVVLDEFHERSLEVDLLLGMLRRLQLELRPELRLMLMSATLDSQHIADYLNHPPIIRVETQNYPVKTIFSRYQATATRGRTPPSPSRRIVEQCVATTREATATHEGDILVFLPGVGEIHQVARELESDARRHGWQLLSLFGDMPPEDQDRVLAPSRQRKVILSTNVAETSLTIENVRTVIDSGWARVQRIDPALGLNMLVLEPISNASADQRTGRAGRTAPGVCYRLWDQITGRSRAAFLEPEVLRVDLSGGVLQLRCWGEADVAAFPWLTAPSPRALEQALQTLQLLGAVAKDGQVTPLGRLMNQLPVQPRLARLLLAGRELGIAREAALAAACLSERDIFDRRVGGGREPSGRDAVTDECDLTRQVVALQGFETSRQTEHEVGTIKNLPHTMYCESPNNCNVCSKLRTRKSETKLVAADPEAMRAASRSAGRLPRSFGSPDGGQARGLMVGGRGVKLDDSSSASRICFYAWMSMLSARRLRRKASAIEAQWLPDALLNQRDERFFHPTAEAVVTRRRSYFLDLLLSETPIETPADEQTAELLARAAAERFERLLPRRTSPCKLAGRVRWLLQQMPDAPLPSLAPENLAQLISGWCFGLRKLDELKQLP